MGQTGDTISGHRIGKLMDTLSVKLVFFQTTFISFKANIFMKLERTTKGKYSKQEMLMC